MGMYSNISPTSGKLYDFEIEGDTPTSEEADKIANYLFNDGLLTTTEDQASLSEDDDAGFSEGIGRGVDLIQQSYGSSLEGAGKALGLQGLQDYGASVAENNRKELEASAGSAKNLDSINDVGSFIDYMQVNLGQQLPNLAPSLAGGYLGGKAGAAAGSVVPGIGTVVGGVVGAVTGAVAANIPFFYGQNREAQKEEIAKGNKVEINEGAALLASLPQSLFDAVADRFLIRGFLAPLAKGGGIFTRAGKGAAAGVITEVPTEIGQQILERLQAGKPLGDEEALDEYLEVGVAAGLLGGTVKGTGEIIGGKRGANKYSELAQDITLQQEQAIQRQKNYEKFKNSFKPQGLLPPPDQSGEAATQEPLQIEGYSNKIKNVISQKALPDLRKKGEVDASTLLAAAAETRQPFKSIPLANLPKEEALRIASQKQRLGLDPSSDVTLTELESIIGPEAATREREIQKPILTTQNREVDASDQLIEQMNVDASIIVEDLIATGPINKNSLLKALTDSYSNLSVTNPDGTQQLGVKVNMNDINSYLQDMESAGILTKNKKGQYIKATDEALAIKTKADAIKERASELLGLQKEEQNVEAIEQELSDLQESAIELEKASNKSSNPDKKTIKADKIIPDYTAKRTSDQAAKAEYGDAYKLKLTSVANAIRARLNEMGLKDVSLETESIIQNEKGFDDAGIEGYFTKTPEGKRIIGLAMDIYDPNLSEEALKQKISGVMNHEIIHALKSMGLFSEKEYATLVNAAKNRKYVAEVNGNNVKRKYTYMDRASHIYSNLDQEAQAEEAVAEMFRDYANKKLTVVGKPKSLFDKIMRFIKAIFTAHNDVGFTKADQIFENIVTSDLSKQIGSRARVPLSARSYTKHSTAGVVAGYIMPKLGDIERIKQSFKDVTSRVDSLTKAAQRLHNNEIDYVAYDKLVNDVKPIVPYETVPAPATVKEMRNALAGEKKIALINKLNEIPEGTRIKLRLDIPSYTSKGVWVPTIHNIQGKAISHESTAIITNADFTMSEADQNKGLDIARRRPYGKDKRMTKSPYATISGDLVQTTPDNSFAEAQAAMNDPTFVQVGFDPERHSYFYDRTTTQPVVSAERVIQVGPLVMAKNPVFEGKEEFKYSKISVTRKSFQFSNPVTTVSDGVINIHFTKDDGDGYFYRSTVDGMTILNPDGSEKQGAFPALPYGMTRKDAIEEATEVLELISQLNQQSTKYSKISSNSEGLENRLIGFIKDNPDGFTIDPDSLEVPSTGKAVAPIKAAEIITRPELITPRLIRDFAKNVQIMTKIAGTMSLDGKVYAGGWLNKKTEKNPDGDGLFYLDATMVIENVNDALYTAYAGNQIAIFDLGEFYETNTLKGIEQLKQNGTFSSDRQARIRSNIQQYSQEFVETRREDPSRQGRKYSSIARARTAKDHDGDFLIDSTIVDEYDVNNEIKPQPEYQSNPEQATEARLNKTLKIDAIRNHQIKRKNKIFDVYSSNPNVRGAARENVSIMLAAELEQALKHNKNAVGWYDKILDAAKKTVVKLFPDIMKNKADTLAFDFALAVASNGMGVIPNFKFASEQYKGWVESNPDVELRRFPVKGTGDRVKAMKNSFAFYNSMKKAGASTDEFIEFMNHETTPKLLKTNQFIIDTEATVPVGESADTPVYGSYIIGPKIGNGFFQNLSKNYKPLTMDIWFMRTINRLTGMGFKKAPTDATVQNNIQRILLAMEGRKQPSKAGEEISENPLNDLDKELIKRSEASLGIDIVTEANALEFATQFSKEYQAWRKDSQKNFVIENGGKEKDAPIPEKTELALSTQRYFENMSIREQDAPRGAPDRAMMRELVNRAREILKDDTGTNIENADSQAAWWFAEKRFFEKLGVAKGTGQDNDYLDGAIHLLQTEGMTNAEIETTLSPEQRYRLYSRTSGVRADGRLRQGDIGGIQVETARVSEEVVTDDPDIRHEVMYEFLEPKEESQIRETVQDIKYSMLTNMFAKNPQLQFETVPTRGKPSLTDTMARKFLRQAKNRNLDKVFGLVRDVKGGLTPTFIQQGEHIDLGGGKYRGFGTAHIEGKRVDKNGKPILTHEQSILAFHDYPSIPHLVDDMLTAYEQQRTDSERELNTDIRRRDTGIRLEPDGGVGNNDIRMEWTKSNTVAGQEDRKIVLSLKYDNTTIKKGNDAIPIYTVRTIYSTPIQSQKRKFSTISNAPPNQTSPNSAKIVADMQKKRQKIRYDLLSGVIAKGLGYVIPQDQALLKAQRILTYMQDAMLPVGALMDQLRKNGYTITDAVDTYMREEVFQGIAGAKVDKVQKELFEPMINVIKKLNIEERKLQELRNIDGATDGIKGFFASTVDEYINPKLAITDAILYAHHALERNKYIAKKTEGAVVNGSGMTNTEANAIIAWTKTLSNDEQVKIQEIRDFAKQINDNTINQRIESGLLPENTLQMDRNDPDSIIVYDNYVPLQGDLDPEAEKILFDDGYGKKRRFSNYFGAIGREDRRATGRSVVGDYAQNITASLMAQNNNAIDRGERNVVGLSFLNLVRGQEEQPDGSIAINESLAKEMDKIAVDVSDVALQDRRSRGIKPDNEFIIKENGKEKIIFIKDDRIARAMNGSMTAQQTSAITKMMGKLNRYLSMINTTYNPSFVIPNFFRDLEAAGVNVQQYDEKGMTAEVLKGSYKAVLGIGAVLRAESKNEAEVKNDWSDLYKRFVKAGGKNATNQMGDVRDQINNIGSLLNEISETGIKKKLGLNKNGFTKKLLQQLDDYNTAVENGVRVATFKALTERGMTETQAAQAARNVTVNFSKGGENKAFMNSWYLFYNASLQGSMALINSAVRSPKVRKVWGGLVVYGMLQDQINNLFSGDEDEDGISDYDELPRHVLEHNLIFPTLGLMDDKFVQIPLSYGLNMATNLGRSLSRVQRGEYTAGEATNSIVGTAFESLSPIGAFDHFLTFASPTVADPFISVSINEDYKGDPIYKESPNFSSNPKPDSQQYWSNTSSIAKTIATSINYITGGDEVEGGFADWSPNTIEYWFGYITGGVGRFAQRTFEAPFDIVDAMKGDFDGDIARSIPLVRKVFIGPSDRADTGNYLDNRQDLFTILSRLDLAKRAGNREDVVAIYGKYKKELSIAGRMKAIDNARNRMLRQIKEIERNPRIPEETKKKIIKLRREKMNDLQQMGLILMRSAGFKKAG